MQKRSIDSVIVNIRATFNNTIITIGNANGDCIAWSSSGTQGFKSSKKATSYAAAQASVAAVESALKKAHIQNGSAITAIVKIKGPGPGAEAAVNAIASKLNILSIENRTSIPYNGPRPRKRRRI